MTPEGRLLLEQSRRTQTNIGALATAMLATLGGKLRTGETTEVEFLAQWVAVEQLAHDQAAIAMADFIKRFRLAQTPGDAYPDPVLDEFDADASFGRGSALLEEAREAETKRSQSDFDAAFQQIIGTFAARGFRHALRGGRGTMEQSSAAAGTRWRRVTGWKPCAFCVMLATRSDYRTEESAQFVVGRASGYGTAHYKATGQVTYGGVMARGARKGMDRRRGTRAPGSRYHDHCACTVVEVVGSIELTEAELAQQDLYQRAAAACDADGLPHSEENILRAMRSLGDAATINDAIEPKTQTGGEGGGRKPPTSGAGAFKEMPDPPDPSDKAAWKAYWKDRQDALPLDFKGDRLEPHEVESFERLVRLGGQVEPIRNDPSRPTADLNWRGVSDVEMKRVPTTAKPALRAIESAVIKAERHQWAPTAKEHFLLDLGPEALSDELRSSLRSYNVGRRSYRIARLWVMFNDGATVEEISLLP